MLDVSQFPYNPWLKATLISSSLYDNETIELYIYIYIYTYIYACDEYCLAT